MVRSIKYLFLIVFCIITASASAQSNESLIQAANNAYNQGLYDSALTTYNQITEAGYESGELYYNMGNAYYKNNDIASAILYYEKALKLLPNDESIEYNLNIANSMIVDKIETVPELFFKDWWNFFYNMFNTDTWAAAALISFSILIFTIGIFIITGKRKTRKLTFYLSLLFMVSTIFSTTLAYQKYYYNTEHKEAIVFDLSITVKSSPTQNAVDLFVIHEGTKVRIIDRIDNWVEIKIKNGSIGWLPANSIKEI